MHQRPYDASMTDRTSPSRFLTLRFGALCVFVLAAALMRFLPHPPNVAPIGAMALFGGALFARKGVAVAMVFTAMLLGDILLGFQPVPIVYFAFAGVVGIGFLLRKNRTPWRIAGASVTGSVLFFIVTNFGVWAGGMLFPQSMYPQTLEGLIACYVAAIPYFHNTLLGDALFTAVLFGGFAFAEKRFPALRTA